MGSTTASSEIETDSNFEVHVFSSSSEKSFIKHGVQWRNNHIRLCILVSMEEGASEADLSILPKYRFRLLNNEEKASGGAGSMIPTQTSSGYLANEQILLPEDTVNGAADHLLRSLLGSQIHYYPIDQYKCVLSYPDVVALEEWISPKDFSTDERLIPKWHIPCDE
ncbi:uncharacterized protein LOC131647492 isoform X2 [Vicia villosa]|uniref:uncharacterized protein LOC131647492 isoform X2 n=1 Tax=Vicia villosa TaxID=3911 RepID=UPI00273C7E92|nr:uncharacterized protein LOC131647492 isoform X2 [Vicia villosa]XP_058773366.1 uncharacterized protein LOC131647492 isoform X2 [Vicia villosa]XP_058773367.1 uncharacterized protein LOC131647492 isoform X2 [Vicia villosa]